MEEYVIVGFWSVALVGWSLASDCRSQQVGREKEVAASELDQGPLPVRMCLSLLGCSLVGVVGGACEST